jgi:hypothetical protein
MCDTRPPTDPRHLRLGATSQWAIVVRMGRGSAKCAMMVLRCLDTGLWRLKRLGAMT